MQQDSGDAMGSMDMKAMNFREQNTFSSFFQCFVSISLVLDNCRLRECSMHKQASATALDVTPFSCTVATSTLPICPADLSLDKTLPHEERSSTTITSDAPPAVICVDLLESHPT